MMLQDILTNPLGFLLWVVALVVAITVHEFAHAFAAEQLGDPTPRLMGRLTLNPLAHLDPIGTIMLLIARFGWGKPVQFDPFNLRNPRRDSAIISIAGPISNILTAILCSIILHIVLALHTTLIYSPILGTLSIIVANLMQPIIMMNVVLAIFNLVPIHPLDGFKIVGGILPAEQAKQWYELEQYGIIFLIFLIFPILGGRSPINTVISPVINFIVSLLIPNTPLI